AATKRTAAASLCIGRRTLLPEANDLQRCLQAYLCRDYRACINMAFPLIQTEPHQVVAQVLVISLQRLGLEQQVQQRSARILDTLKEHPWEQTLLRVTLGQIDPNTLLDQTENEAQRCQVLYYAGARALTLGQLEEARRLWLQCQGLNTNCLEGQLAQKEST